MLALKEGESSTSCDVELDKIKVCSADYGTSVGWLGLAQVWTSGTHIRQALAKMNDSFLISGAYSSDAWRQLVMCQEIGHDFGLDHQDENFNNANLLTCIVLPQGSWTVV